MKQKIKQLKLLLSLEEKKISDALLKYTMSNQAFMNAKSQHQQLVAYQADYSKCLTTKNNQMTAQTLGVYYRFIDKLGFAIKEQAVKVSMSEKRSQQLFKNYLMAKKKSEGLEKLLAKEMEIEKQEQVKQEQKQYDESASNQWYLDRDN